MFPNIKSIFIIYIIFITRLLGVSVDCPVIFNFLRGLNLHQTDTYLFQSIPTDCCNFVNSDGLAVIDIECMGNAANEHIFALQLDYVNVNGTIKSQYIPSSVNFLQITNTPMNTTIPIDLPNTLQTLYLYANSLHGNIPDTLPNQLVISDFSRNQLSGLPNAFPIGNNAWYLYQNRFTKLPVLQENLQVLYIADNLIVDTLPNSYPSTMIMLYIQNNVISGPFPNLPNGIQNLYLSNNKLQGPIPTTLPAQLVYFEAYGNQFSGNLPILPASLQTLKLDSNLLTGNLPQTWPSGLKTVSLSRNQLNGSISSIGSASSITDLDLSWNAFNGSLPIFISTYSRVDLSHNQLSGDIDLGYSTIYDLRLSFNKFDKFPKSLPKSLPKLINALKLDNNGMQGNIAYDLSSSFTIIDLSNNNLTGNIPNVLGNPIYLNISNNSFTGSIPQSLRQVKTLDISHNYLSGCINYSFSGSNFYFNDNYLSGNLSFTNPSLLYLQNNNILDVFITDASKMGQNCDLANNSIAPGVFGKTFQNQCNLNGIYKGSSDCRILTPSEIINLKKITLSSSIPSYPQLQTMPFLQSSSNIQLPSTTTSNIVDLLTQVDKTIITRPIRLITTLESSLESSSDFSIRFESKTTLSNITTTFSIPYQHIQLQLFKLEWSYSNILKLFINTIILIIVLKLTPFKQLLRKKTPASQRSTHYLSFSMNSRRF
eukprot:NODE_647_length_5045_cov_0.419733.p1 type:complete len:709 gc:universal NODE_647_length_5045_cov_0.419733:842-2968(+)